MKNSIVCGLLCFAALGFTGCSEEEPFGTKGTGTIAPNAVVDATVTSSRSRAEATDITRDDLSIRLTAADGSYTETWARLADFPTDKKFAIGKYTIEAFYGDENTEGFESPRFYGSEEITVADKKTTTVNLTATLATAMVSIDYTESFKEYLTSWKSQLHSPGGSYITFEAAETRPAYIKPGNVSIYVDFVMPDGTSSNLNAASFTAAAATHYHVTLDITQGAGKAFLTVIFDESTEQEPISIDLTDLENAPAPTVTAEGFDPAQPVAIVPGFTSGESVKFNIIARGTLSKVTMTTQSSSLLSQGWPAEIDLIAATEAEQSTLQGLGLECLGIFKNPEKMAVVDLSKVLDHLTVVNGNNTSTITILAEDRQCKVSEAVTVTIEAQELQLALSNPSVLTQGGESVDVDLTFNAGDPNNYVTIQYLNNRGTWSNATATYTETSENVYRATVTIPGTVSAITLRPTTSNKIGSELTIERAAVDMSLTANENDTYATYALLSANLTSVSDDALLSNLLDNAVVLGSTDDGVTYTTLSATRSGNVLRVSGLVPNSNYILKLQIGGVDCATALVATEAATQLSFGDMESWYQEAGQSDYWWISYCGTSATTIWGTLNQLTTSEGGSNTSSLSTSRDGFPYNAISGTDKTEDAHSGTYAALIRSVGYGKGNNAVGNTSTAKCAYVSKGELYLGTYNNGPSYGIDFTSRPSSIQFYYKYTAKNSADYGYAEAYVLDASGNVIASDTFKIVATGSYTLHTLNLSYADGAAKAKTLKLRFSSSDNPDCTASYSSDYFTPPSFASSSEAYVGSQLYIDDIVLNY